MLVWRGCPVVPCVIRQVDEDLGALPYRFICNVGEYPLKTNEDPDLPDIGFNGPVPFTGLEIRTYGRELRKEREIRDYRGILAERDKVDFVVDPGRIAVRDRYNERC